MVKITDRNGRVIECQDAAEAIAVLQHLHSEERNLPDKSSTPIAELLSLLLTGDKKHTAYWDRTNFWKFID